MRVRPFGCKTLRIKMPGRQENTYFTSFFSPSTGSNLNLPCLTRTSLGVDAIHDEYQKPSSINGDPFFHGMFWMFNFLNPISSVFFRKNTLQQTPCSPGTIDSLCNQILPDIGEVNPPVAKAGQQLHICLSLGVF